MKASKITIEIAFNNKIEFVSFTNITVWEAIKQLKKKYGEVLIYDLKAQY
jgi:hypothetical protein